MKDPVVLKLNQLFDERSKRWSDTYRTRSIDGTIIQVAVPREDRHPQVIHRHLMQNGAALPPLDGCRDELTAASSVNSKIVYRAARTGWRNANASFVCHHYVVGEGAEGSIVPPEQPANGGLGRLERRGTLAGWKAIVACAKHSTAMTLSLCVPFAAPLLALLNRQSFAIVLVGPSRSGKSTAQLAAASAIGFGAEEDLPTLNATPAGLLATALNYNDHMLPINEVGTAPGPKHEIYVSIRNSTYALVSGQDILRHPVWAGSSPGGHSSFQVIPLLSSEHSPDAWAARNGEVRDEGETARLIGVPVTFGGSRSIFDRPPKSLTGSELTAWTAEQFRNLRENLPENRGVAFRIYVHRLLRHLVANRNRASYLVEFFEGEVATPQMAAVPRDIVAKFGVLFAGGVLALEGGVLPLDMTYVFHAVRRACLAALAELPDPAGEIRADLNLLRERLASGAILDFEASTMQELRLMLSADGYHRPQGGGRLFVVRSQVLHQWFGSLLRTKRVLEWLDGEGFLQHARERIKSRSNEWAQTQVTWPDGTRQRSISIYLPNGLTNLTLDR